MIDLHAHILPGVDDGAKTFNDSLAMLKELEKCHITDVICTPHHIPETNYASPASENRRIFNELKVRAEAAGLKINLYLGNEIYLSDQLFSLLKKHTIMPLNGSEYLLIELPLSGEFTNYEEIFKILIRAGWRIILAHPERYRSAQKDYDILLDLRNSGVLFQCDLGSLIGQYGKSAQRLVKKLAKDRLIFAFGSDIHHVSRSGDRYKRAQLKLLNYYKPTELEQLLDKNALNVLN